MKCNKFWRNAGKCWHGGGTVVANAGRVGGMRGAARLRQKLTEFDKFDKQFSTPCSPSGAADLIAPRIPPNRLRWFVDWLIGSLVSWLPCILVDFSGQKKIQKAYKVVSHALLPFAGGGLNRSAHSPGPTPKACGLVDWFFGVFVVGVFFAVQGAFRRFAKWRLACVLETTWGRMDWNT